MGVNNINSNMSNDVISDYLSQILDGSNSSDDATKAQFSALLSNAINKNSDTSANTTSQIVTDNSIHTSAGTVLNELPLIVNGRAYYNSSNNYSDSSYSGTGKMLDTKSIDNLNVSGATVVDCSGNIDSATMNRIKTAAKNAANKYGVDSNLILAIINHESGYQPNVTSSSGAQGLMQILPSNFGYANITNGYNIEQNIDGGTKLLKNCIDLYDGDIGMGLIAYAGGCGVMANRGVNSYSDLYKMPSEAKKAVPEIIAGYQMLKRRNG